MFTKYNQKLDENYLSIRKSIALHLNILITEKILQHFGTKNPRRGTSFQPTLAASRIARLFN